MNSAGVTDANPSAAVKEALAHGFAIGFYRRHLRPSLTRLTRTEAVLSGWAGLVDFAGALQAPKSESPEFDEEDDRLALACDWYMVGTDVWSGIQRAIGRLPDDQRDRLIAEVVRMVAEGAMTINTGAEEQLRLDWDAEGDTR